MSIHILIVFLLENKDLTIVIDCRNKAALCLVYLTVLKKLEA